MAAAPAPAPPLPSAGAELYRDLLNLSETAGLGLQTTPSVLFRKQDETDFRSCDLISSLLQNEDSALFAQLMSFYDMPEGSLLPQQCIQNQPQVSERPPAYLFSHFLASPAVSELTESSTMINDTVASFYRSQANGICCDSAASDLRPESCLRSPSASSMTPKDEDKVTDLDIAPKTLPGLSHFQMRHSGPIGSTKLPCECGAQESCRLSTIDFCRDYPTSAPDLKNMSQSAANFSVSSQLSKVETSLQNSHNGVVDSSAQKPDNLKNLNKTEFYKLHDKNAWRKGVAMQDRGIAKRKKCSRKAGLITQLGSECGKVAQLQNDIIDQKSSSDKKEAEPVTILVRTHDLKLQDGYNWLKYGQKEIKGHLFSRIYLRCDQRKRTGCSVLKHTQRLTEDQNFVEFVYFGTHNHLPPQPFEATEPN